MIRQVLLALATTVAFAQAAVAGPAQPYTKEAFAAAQKEGKPILVDIHADWCPTCKAQGTTLSAIATDPAFSGLTIFEVDFDKQKDVVRFFQASRQSTLIAFNGAKETARSVGSTNAKEIRALAGSALAK